MNSRFVCAALAALELLAGCGAAPPPQHAATPPGPRGFIASAPPGDTSFTPLRCVPNGPGYDCARTP